MAQFGAASISARSHESVAAGIITEHPRRVQVEQGWWSRRGGGVAGGGKLVRVRVFVSHPRGAILPLTSAKAVTEDMVHEAVETVRLWELPISPPKGPLDNGRCVQ